MPRALIWRWSVLALLAVLALGCQATPAAPGQETPQVPAPSPTRLQATASLPTLGGTTAPAPQGPGTPVRPQPVPGSPQSPGFPMPVPLTPPPGQEPQMPVRQPIPLVEEAEPRGQKGPFYLEQAALERNQDLWQVLVDGTLPTPCHRPYYQAFRQGDQLRLEVFTVRLPDVMCPQVVQPFQGYIDLTPWTQGLTAPLQVLLNDQDLGTVEP